MSEIDKNSAENIKYDSGKPEKAKLPVRKYFVIAGVCVLAGMLLIVFYFICYRFDGFSDGFNSFWKALGPVVMGFVLAYLLNPIVRGTESVIYPQLRTGIIRRMVKNRYFEEHPGTKKIDKKELAALLETELDERTMEIPAKRRSHAHKSARNIGIAVAFVGLFGVFTLLGRLIIPQMIVSIKSLLTTVPAQMTGFFKWLESFTNDDVISQYIEDIYSNWSDSITKWATNTLLPELTDALSTIYNGVSSAIKAVINAIIGLCVGIYLLSGKETFTGQAKKITYAVFKPKAANLILSIARKTNDIFQNYIVGVLLDALIVGISVYILSLIFKIPYAPLVAVIVGVTNIIPIFGPFIGAIPSLFFVLIESPIKALILLVIIFVIQQLDGNVVKPIVFGNSVGLSSFWILFAIVIGGELFGFTGMIIGVPMFAVIYYLMDELITWILWKKGLPVDTQTYIRLNRINLQDNSVNNDEIEIPKRPGELYVEKVRSEQGDGEESLSLIQRLRKIGKSRKTPFDLDYEDNIKREQNKAAHDNKES